MQDAVLEARKGTKNSEHIPDPQRVYNLAEEVHLFQPGLAAQL